MILVARLGGAHIHLCLDGEKPAASLHLSDSGLHTDAHAGHGTSGEHQAHSDADILLFDDLLGKPSKISLEIFGLIFAGILLAFLRRPPQQFSHGPDADHARRSLLFLRPPLRGPPRGVH
mgnify:FL=1